MRVYLVFIGTVICFVPDVLINVMPPCFTDDTVDVFLNAMPVVLGDFIFGVLVIFIVNALA
jgi:hypothetical protein